MMNELKYEPIGKVKVAKGARYWRARAAKAENELRMIAIAAFTAGVLCGVFIGLYA